MAITDLTSYKVDKLALVISGIFMQQTAFGARLATGDIDTRQPQTTPAGATVNVTREQIFACDGVIVLKERINSRFARYQIVFDATAQLVYGWLAYLDGVSASPTGTPQNERQTIKSTAVAGNHTFDLGFEGMAGGGVAVPFNATPAVVQSALEQCNAIGKGNVTVTGTALNNVAGLLVEFVNDLAKANLPLMTVTGTAGATVTATQNGANNLHLGARSVSDTSVLFSVVQGFLEDTRPAKKYGDLAAESVAVAATRRGKLQITVVAVGSADYDEITDFDFPECNDEPPLMVEDCRLQIGTSFFIEDLREFALTKTNEVDTGEDAFPYAGKDIRILEKGVPTAGLTLQVLGSDNDDLYKFAYDEENAFDVISLYLGVAGERTIYTAPNAQFRLADTAITFVGKNRKSAINLIATPRPDTDGTIDSFEYNGAQTAAFLTT